LADYKDENVSLSKGEAYIIDQISSDGSKWHIKTDASDSSDSLSSSQQDPTISKDNNNNIQRLPTKQRCGNSSALAAQSKPVVQDSSVPGFEVVSLGKMETDLEAEGKEFNLEQFPFSPNSREDKDVSGFITLITDPDTETLLGVRMIGPNASSHIQDVLLALDLPFEMDENVEEGKDWASSSFLSVIPQSSMTEQQQTIFKYVLRGAIALNSTIQRCLVSDPTGGVASFIFGVSGMILDTLAVARKNKVTAVLLIRTVKNLRPVISHVLHVFEQLPKYNQEILIGCLDSLHEELKGTLETINGYYYPGTMGKVIRFCNSHSIEFQFKLHHKSIQSCVNNLHFAWSVGTSASALLAGKA